MCTRTSQLAAHGLPEVHSPNCARGVWTIFDEVTGLSVSDLQWSEIEPGDVSDAVTQYLAILASHGAGIYVG